MHQGVCYIAQYTAVSLIPATFAAMVRSRCLITLTLFTVLEMLLC